MELDKFMKILYCITRSTWGGAQENIWELIKNQVKLNNQAILVVGDNGDLAKKVKENLPKVKVIILPSLQRSINPIKDLIAITEFRKIVKSEGPDIVHLHSSKAGVIGRLACRGLKSKVVFTVHGWSFTDGIASSKKKALYRFIEKRMEPLTDKFICVSKYDYNIGKRDKVLVHPEKACVVYNGINYKFDPKENKNTHFPIKFIMTARFSKQKDQLSLIKAFKHVNTKACQLIFVGNGPTMQDSKKLVKKYGLTDCIKFVGFKKHVDKYLKQSDVFILSTHYEGLPISIIEAMSHAMPVVASDVGGNSELVENGKNGFLTTNINDLTKTIDFFISHPEKINEMGMNSLMAYQSYFTLDKFLLNTQEIYNSLLKNKK